MELKFVKMHGAGNDYIYFDCFEHDISNPNELSIKLSDRHKGIGGDGIVLILPSNVADAKMRMFNADGSEGKMCGNAIRCVAKYLFDRKRVGTHLTIETLSGIKTLDVIKTDKDGKALEVKVDMGAPILEPSKIPCKADGDSVIDKTLNVDGVEYKVTCVSMGNPHVIVFVDDVDDFCVEKVGRKFERHTVFPEGVNTEFVQVIDKSHVKMRVWERGSGETMACGTGACATAVACVLNNKTGRKVEVELLGGTLLIEYTDTVFMTGNAVEVFDGIIEG